MDKHESKNPFEINAERLRYSIEQNWIKYQKKHDSDEATYLIFENFYRVIENRLDFLLVTYETLIRLNNDVQNHEMVKHLQAKLSESSSKYVRS
ncbi:hypothetical protein [Bacillus inaquosorum]|uniref:hypothetical protein n=1 Tax=Bacillus inaquosorum TaxID=483913 RepID=UPI00227F706A|nr:hypothetical protein [Bacillus inaquosorum]MCY7953011.1 hypothetical protein [Bacillus inaquosorum]MEC0520189.1 hypothetical protein [Bacillus inaquosorum]MEC0607113.1 hypothetical protein [Bacillus inaquosorum]